jgi:hypothetical protein
MTEKNNRVETFVAIQPETFYQQFCVKKGWCKENAWLIIGDYTYNEWYSKKINQGLEAKLPYPTCTADTYDIALGMCDELNGPVLTTMKRGK